MGVGKQSASHLTGRGQFSSACVGLGFQGLVMPV